MDSQTATDSLQDVEVAISDGVLFQELNGELVLLSTHTGEYFGLNEVGAKMWVLLTSDWSVSDMLKSMLSQYEVSEEQLVGDIERFLNALEDAKLITVIRSDV